MQHRRILFSWVSVLLIVVSIALFGVLFFGGRRPMPTPKLEQAGRSDLHYAARDGDVPKAKGLLDQGADVNQRDKHGWTPLHFAAQEQQVDVANLLLKVGASVDARNEHGNTPLMVAIGARSGDGEMISLLRKWGADPKCKNNYGVSPVESARQIANYDVARFFADVE
jgi:ankyrin repeat protein